MGSSNIHKASEILKICFQKENLRLVDRYSTVFRDWSTLVGDQYSQHSKVFDLKNNQIIVEVDHPGWIQKLRMKDQFILSRVQQKYPELNITGITYFLKEKALTDKTEKKRIIVTAPSIKQDKQGENITIKDEKLKATLERIRDHIFSNDGK